MEKTITLVLIKDGIKADKKTVSKSVLEESVDYSKMFKHHTPKGVEIPVDVNIFEKIPEAK